MTAKSDTRLMHEESVARAVIYALEFLSEESVARIPLLPETPNRAHVDATLSGLALEFSRINFEGSEK